MSNPYKFLPDHCFWSRGVVRTAPGAIDPVVRSEVIFPGNSIVTMGSCFAQHISRHLVRKGYTYLVTETPPEASPAADQPERYGYSLFSARYGNVYTVRQALQLFNRAFGHFTPAETCWAKGERWVSPYRPTIEPDGFESQQALEQEDARHLECVQRAFKEADWIILTLGLTEAWRAKQDGAVFPIPPGVSGGIYDPARHEFVNFTASDVIHDLGDLIQRVRGINPSVKFILTVSPVALAATYENRHVLAASCYSKSVLRVAADAAERGFPGVYYFPAFEVITSPAVAGRYYRNDLRQVTEAGVAHVTRLFDTHFMAAHSHLEAAQDAPAQTAEDAPAANEEEADTPHAATECRQARLKEADSETAPTVSELPPAVSIVFKS